MYFLTTGSNNTAVGYQALDTGGGSSNVAVGSQSLTTSTGSYNVAVGGQALYSETTANDNAAFGTQALTADTTGSDNVGIGTNALYRVTTGSQNVAVGFDAGVNSSPLLTTISNSTFVGWGASSSTDGLTNMIVLGWGAVGTASNTGVIGNASVTDVYVGGATALAAIHAVTYKTSTNCSSAASPAVCGSSSAGNFVIAAGATTLTINTTAVTASSQIFMQGDESLGTKLGVTCNTTITSLLDPVVTSRTAGTSFSIATSATITVNPACFSYEIIN